MYNFIFLVKNFIMEKVRNFYNSYFKEFNIWYILFYLIFYSVIGYILETGFGLFSKGVLESRQSFLYGPFCAIYGIAATLMIILLTKHKNNTILIFISSIIIGAGAEYLMSLICELIFHFKWWDYSGYFLNINGRICLTFALIWGFLGIFLIKYLNPLINKFINFIKNKISTKFFKGFIIALSIFLIFDIFISATTLRMFFKKVANEHNIDSYNNSSYTLTEKFVANLYNEHKLLKVYPNMKIAGTSFDNIYIDSLYKDIETYYYKWD